MNGTDAYINSLNCLIGQLNKDEEIALCKLNEVDLIMGELDSIRNQKRRAIEKLDAALIETAVIYPSVIGLDEICEV